MKIPHRFLILFTSLLFIFLLPQFSSAQEICTGSVVQVTNNTTEDGHLGISGNNLVWEHQDGNDYEIQFWNGTSIIDITNNDTVDLAPEVSGTNVVWYGHDGNDFEIYLWDGTSTKQLTNNNVYDAFPVISGTGVAWFGTVGSDDELFYWDGSTTTQITNNNRDDRYPLISDGNVTWYASDGNDYEIYFWNGSSVQQVTNNTRDDLVQDISGTNIVWSINDGTDSEIIFWNGSTTTQITNNTVSDLQPSVSGNNVVWHQWDGTDYEFFLWDGTTTTQITNNTLSDVGASIDGTTIAWSTPIGGDYEAFYWDGDTIFQITNNTTSDYMPMVSGSHLAWIGSDGDLEVYYFDLTGCAAIVPLPVVTSTTPLHGAVNVALDMDAVINFSEPVSSVFASATCDGTPPILIIHDGSTEVDSFTYPASWLAGATCTVTVLATTLDGRELDGNGDGISGDSYTFSFSTEPQQPASSYSSNPTTGSTLAADDIVILGSTATLTLTITNQGQDGSLLDVTQVGALNNFTISTLPTSLTPSDGAYDITITCTVPQVSETLTLQTNEPGNPTYSYKLQCLSGFQFQEFSFATDSSSMSEININRTVTVNLTLSPLVTNPDYRGIMEITVQDTEQGEAIPGVDYTYSQQTLTWDCTAGCAPGTYPQSITLAPLSDSAIDPDERIFLVLAVADSSTFPPFSSLGITEHVVTIDDYTPPTVVSTTPLDGAVDVPSDTNVSIQFSEVLDAISVFVVCPSSGTSGFAGTGQNTDIVTLPFVTLPPGETCTVTVSGATGDGRQLDGNGDGVGSDDYIFSFTVAAPEVTPEVTPEITPEVTPELTPETTPEVTPEVTPETTPEVTPEITPEVTPEITPEITPEVTPETTPEVTVEPTAEVTDNPVVTLPTEDADDGEPQIVPIISIFDPAISKIGFLLPGQVGVTGEQVEWMVTVSNTGTVAGNNVVVSDTLVPALRIDSVNAPGASVNINGQTVTVTYPIINPGQSFQFSIVTMVLQGIQVENTACVNATNQAATECATGSAITSLPSTGESPAWRTWLWFGGLIPLLGLYMWRRRML
jgi:uncharacterized repeat protein (TIGR01451 family)